MFELPQNITYWTSTGNNGTGGKTWAAPLTAIARIADVSKIIQSSDGKDQHAKKAIYTEVNIPVGAYIVEGLLADLTPTDAAQLVLLSTSNPSITNMNKCMV